VVWIQLDQDTFQQEANVNTVMNLRVPLKVGYFLTSWATFGFSRRTCLFGCGVLRCLRHRMEWKDVCDCWRRKNTGEAIW